MKKYYLIFIFVLIFSDVKSQIKEVSDDNYNFNVENALEIPKGKNKNFIKKNNNLLNKQNKKQHFLLEKKEQQITKVKELMNENIFLERLFVTSNIELKKIDQFPNYDIYSQLVSVNGYKSVNYWFNFVFFFILVMITFLLICFFIV